MSYELSKCVKTNDGSLICWDCVLKQFVRVSVEPIKPADIPADFWPVYNEEIKK